MTIPSAPRTAPASEYRKDDLGELLEGDGVRQSETEVGSGSSSTDSSFDIESGYVSDDFDSVDEDSQNPAQTSKSTKKTMPIFPLRAIWAA